MTIQLYAKKNAVFVCYVGLISQADTKLLQANPTLAAGDAKVAIDDGAPADLQVLPVVDADFPKRVKIFVAAAELTGDNSTVILSDAAGSQWCDLILNIRTTPIDVGQALDALVAGQYHFAKATGIETIRDSDGNVLATLTVVDTPTELTKS
jgi:hypothetical protein